MRRDDRKGLAIFFCCGDRSALRLRFAWPPMDTITTWTRIVSLPIWLPMEKASTLRLSDIIMALSGLTFSIIWIYCHRLVQTRFGRSGGRSSLS